VVIAILPPAFELYPLSSYTPLFRSFFKTIKNLEYGKLPQHFPGFKPSNQDHAMPSKSYFCAGESGDVFVP